MPVRPGTKDRCRPSPLRKPHPRSNGHWPTRAHTHGPTVNGRMTPRQVRKFCTLKPEAQCILKAAMEEFGLSARAHDKVLRVERKSEGNRWEGNQCRLYFRAEIDVVSRISTEKVNRPPAPAGRRLLGEIRSRVRVQSSWPSSIGSGILESSIYLPGRSHDDQTFRRSQAGHRGTWRGARVCR